MWVLVIEKELTMVMVRKCFLFFCFVSIFFFTVSCGYTKQDLASEDPSKTSSDTSSGTNLDSDVSKNTSAAVSRESFYTITNDFHDYKGLEPQYILLSSTKTGQNYIIPPTQYSSVELKYIRIDIKVEGDCVKIPVEAFPVSVSVCKSGDCSSVRPLNVLLKNPAHYSIHGIGGLLTPQIYPVSPCSADFVKLIDTIGEYGPR